MFSIIKKQYFYKLNANFNLFYFLIVAQIIILILSIEFIMSNNFTGSMSTQFISIGIKFYSFDVINFLSLLWIIIASFIFSQSKIKFYDFTFVSNRLTSNISNSLFLITCCIYATLSTQLLSTFLKTISYYFARNPKHILFVDSGEPIQSTLAMLMYFLVVSALIYLMVNIYQINEFILIPVVVIFSGEIIREKMNVYEENYLLNVLATFTKENDFKIFLIKSIAIILISFTSSIIISNRLEVRK